MATPEPVLPYAIRQFEIDVLVPIHIFGIDASFTVSSQAMVTTVVLVTFYLLYAVRNRQLRPGRLQASAEIIYEFVVKAVVKNGGIEAKPAVPLIFTIFVFILFGTVIGLTPVKFTFTSHLVVTFTLAMLVFTYATGLAIRKRGTGFLRQFVPKGTPAYIAPIIFVIELISYLFRPITLGTRLFANILAGHVMVKLCGDFCVMLIDGLGPVGFFVAILPLALMVVLYAFEFVIVFVQSYIFIMLSATYIGEGLRGH